MTSLTFMGHVSNICKKVSAQEDVLSRLWNMIPTKAKPEIYKSAILPQLTYCQTVWQFCCLSGERKVKRVQERELVAVYYSKSAKLPTLRSRHNYI